MLRYGAKYFLKNGKKCLHCVQEYYIIKIVKDDEQIQGGFNHVDQRILNAHRPYYESYPV